MNAVPQPRPKRVVIYTRVSSEDQKERETIRTQQMELSRQLMANPDVDFLGEYSDDGVSGTIRFQDRPGGKRLLDDAARGVFEEVWVYRVDRLGRDDIDPLVVWRELERLRVRVVSLTEGVDGPFIYHIRVAVAAEERRTMLMRMQAGMDRAAREGRYTGGIRPFGYRVVGYKENARYVPDEEPFEGHPSEAAVVRQMYQWMGLEDYTCWAVADELNARSVPTHFTRDGRGLRGKKTSGGWGAGRVRSMVVNSMYKGERRYGRRSLKPAREIITGPVPALVSAELWQKAQDTLASHVCRPKTTARFYLLRGVMRCGACGRSYVGSQSTGKIYYRCTGHLRRLGTPDICRAAGLKAQIIEARVWAEVERLLLEPSPPSPPCGLAEECAPAPVDPAPLRDMLLRKDEERRRLLAAYVGEAITLAEFQAEVAGIDQTKKALEERLRALQEVEGPEPPELLDEAALGALRARLGHPLDEAEQREVILAILGRVTVHREPPETERKAKLVVEHRVSATPFVFYV